MDRDPLTPHSRLTGKSDSTRNYHKVKANGRWVFCGCLKEIRGVKSEWGPFHRSRRKEDTWASAFRYLGLGSRLGRRQR